jgi:LysR family hydrogen peroxide-inducible transcriptional activator
MRTHALTLKHLRYFAAVARHGHFGRAAEACAISQPALSLQIKQMEALVGVALIERDTRNVRLTQLGRTVAARAEEVLRAVDDLGDVVRAASGEVSGVLRLGVIPTVAPYLLPAAMSHLARAYPKLEVLPRETVTASLVEGLLGGDLDAALVALPLGEAALIEHPLLSEEFLLVRARSEAGRPVPDAAALREMRLLLLEEGHCFRDQALSFCDLGAARARDIMEGSSLTTLVQLVGSGVGVTLIPQMAAPIETRLADVEIVRFEPPAPRRSIGMVWRRTSPLDAQLRRVAATIHAAATPLIGAPMGK